MDVGEMIISLCIPIMNRVYDLRETLPLMIQAANVSPPVEIVILDYNSSDGLKCYIDEVTGLDYGNLLRYFQYTKSQYYHAAHARNLVSLLSTGEYMWQLGSDALISADSIQVIRQMIAEGCIWMTTHKFYQGNVVVQREEFMAAGGYDERFELYGPEDRDLNERLERRGGKFGKLPSHIVNGIDTSKAEKVKNFRFPELSRYAMAEKMYVYYRENTANKILVANEGKEWGVW